MISIIIPTLNEERYLPLLFESIKKQDFKDYEMIVADAKSTDRTVEIAKENGCKVIPGGMPGKARNEGAKVARGDVLLFLDADALLPANFLENSLRDFNKKVLGVATFPVYFTGGGISKMISWIYNWWVVVAQLFLPHALGAVLMARKDVYDKIGGFDEEIKLAEDHDFARRASKIAKCGVIRSTHALVSNRRFEKDGWLSVAVSYILCELYIIFIGPVKTDIFKYKFGHYDNDKKGIKK